MLYGIFLEAMLRWVQSFIGVVSDKGVESLVPLGLWPLSSSEEPFVFCAWVAATWLLSPCSLFLSRIMSIG